MAEHRSMAEVELILLRHGIADPRGSGIEDRLRALTPEGRERTWRICQRAAALGLAAPALVSSPLVRARQTAEIAVEAGLAPTLVCSDGLAPGADPWPLLHGWLGSESAGDPRRLILVGHEPDLGQLACRLITAPPGAVILKKGGVAMLRWLQTFPAPDSLPQAQLRLLLTPRALIGPSV